MIVLGVDPGVAATGYGVVERRDGAPPRLLECGVWRPRTRAPLPERLRDIYEGLVEVVDRLRPDVLSVEGVFFGRNVRTAVVLGQARGVVLLVAAQRGVGIAEYAPAQVKSALTGTGSAAKGQVAFMVQQHLRLSAPPAPADAADAVAVALCHLGHVRTPAPARRARTR
jgi:crossover junction endodeoxyribonuclease RuvC